MSLYDLYDGMTKVASRNDHEGYANDEWAQLAAENGMSKDEFMDKVAEQQALEEVELVKTAQEATYFGKCIGYGYMDTLTKVANASPVRDEIPEVHIKIAQQCLAGIVNHMVKAANTAEDANYVLEKQAGEKLRHIGRGIAGMLPKAETATVRLSQRTKDKFLGIPNGLYRKTETNVNLNPEMKKEIRKLLIGAGIVAGGTTAAGVAVGNKLSGK